MKFTANLDPDEVEKIIKAEFERRYPGVVLGTIYAKVEQREDMRGAVSSHVFCGYDVQVELPDAQVPKHPVYRGSGGDSDRTR